jgi:penicillin-binding protein 1A
VRQSKLDEVPSLALGTSPVTLREMVAAYGTIANGGSYIEPVLVLRVEDSKGAVLEEFHPGAAEPALATPAALTLLDAMRGVIDRGTGTGIRKQFGIQGDVAGKTGTTQDNTDGWFILMHPQLVAGAWVGFNDNRVTLSDYWGQGAHSALPVVGDFFQQTLKAKAVDVAARFAPPPPDSSLTGRINDWFNSVFAPAAEPVPATGQAAAFDPAVPAVGADADAAQEERRLAGRADPAAAETAPRTAQAPRTPQVIVLPPQGDRGSSAVEGRAPRILMLPSTGAPAAGAAQEPGGPAAPAAEPAAQQ